MTKELFKSSVKKIIHSSAYEDCRKNLRKIRTILKNKDLFVGEEERIKFINYYENIWTLPLKKWAGLYTSKLQCMDCTTTQRAESNHSVLKKGTVSLQPLDTVFDCINEYLEAFEREYNEIELSERSTVNPFMFKVSYQVLEVIRVELNKVEDGKKESQDCPYKCKVIFGIPCYYLPSLLGRKRLYLTDIPSM